MESPFLRPDNVRYADVLTDAAVHVLAAHGIDRFSVRALARWMGVVPATILGEFSRARVLELICICYEERWLAWSGSRPWPDDADAQTPLRLPSTPDEDLGVRVLSALQHLADAEALRGNSAPRQHLQRLHQKELDLLRFRMRSSCCSTEPDDGPVRAVLAFAMGLRIALATEGRGMTRAEGAAALRAYADMHGAHANDCLAARRAS